MNRVPFNKPWVSQRALAYLRQSLESGALSGDGPFTRKASLWLQQESGCARALVTHSGTAGLELAALLADIQPGDEVIMPSFTFTSTANAFVLRGAVPVFVDVRPDTLNLDERIVERAITPKTKAIVPVHYAGVACEMDRILAIGREHDLAVIEDAAQCLGSTYRKRPVGSHGTMAALSFHATKNVGCGEGGALLINDPSLAVRAEILRQKGTNRDQFLRGEVSRYTWVDIGSSFLPSDLSAAFLLAQLEDVAEVNARRLVIWNAYHERLSGLEESHGIRRPVIPSECGHNGHIYWLLAPDGNVRTRLLQQLSNQGIDAVIHYVPLHSSPAGKKYGRIGTTMIHTDRAESCLLRLPLWIGMESEVDRITDVIRSILRKAA